MKHKFKPSVGSNRARKAAPGGGQGEKPSSDTPTDSLDLRAAGEKSQNVSSSEEPASASEEACASQRVAVPGEPGHPVGRGGEGEGKSSGTVEDTAAEVEERSVSLPQRPQVAPTTSSSVRARKKVAPTVAPSRPRRPRPDNSNRDESNPKRNGLPHTGPTESANLTSSAGGVEISDQCSREGVSAEDGGSLGFSDSGQPTAIPQGNNEVREERRKEAVPNSQGQDRESEVEETSLSLRPTGDGNLSGVVRSSLDLVCPPPTGNEGAAFQLGREEQRPVHQSVGSEGGEPGGGVSRSGEEEVEGEEGQNEGDSQAPTGTTGAGKEKKNSDGQDKETRRTKSRKRSSQSKTPAATTESTSTEGAKRRRRRTGTGGNDSQSPSKVRKAPDRTSMTMQELIYYNPSANPMSSSVEERKRRSQRSDSSPVEQEESSRSSSRVQTPAPPSSDASSEVSSADPWGDSQDSGRIVPQLRMGKDGNIILDEGSMVVAATARPLPFDDPLNPPLVEGCGHTTSASYRKSSRVTRWTGEETGVFFKALSQVGTDFTMMTLLLPKRTRKELKNKFKKEERSNPHRVSLALKSQLTVRRSSVPQSGPVRPATAETPS